MSQPKRAPCITELAATIQANTSRYNDYLEAQKIIKPSHDAQVGLAPFPALPQEIVDARAGAIEAVEELHSLLLGPVDYMLTATSEQFKVLSLQFVCRYNLATKVPLEGCISYEQLARECNLDVDDTTRLLRLAVANHVFYESNKGFISHNAMSMALAQSPLLTAWIRNTSEELWPSFTQIVNALSKWPGSGKAAETAYVLAHSTDGSVFDAIDRDPEKASRFADAMGYWLTNSKFAPDAICFQFDFQSLGSQALVIEMGGSLGQVSQAIAARFPNVCCIVQDLPSTIANAPVEVPATIRDRVSYMTHDFFTDQPVLNADVYYFRWCLHDWSDEACVQIFQHLVPAMKSGARVLIHDNFLPPFGTVGRFQEKQIRALDITLKAFSNGRERSADDWASVFRKADPRFTFLGVKPNTTGNQLALIEAQWCP